MGRSKYPEKYDTSVEIPQVRGNIHEVGVDVLNSLRSAIFQIEHTLGINPQGSAVSTISDRLSKSLDSNGNIKKEAFDKAGVLYGPITNEVVAKTAGIEESKLKLDFPTSLLQTEISLTVDKIDYLLNQFSELSSKFSSHIYPDAVNRHTAKSISIQEILGQSDVGLNSISNGNIYTAIEEILKSHIKYSGLNIAADNNSHSSDQIFFDNTNVSSYIDSSDVQGAIEDLSLVAAGQQTDHQDKFHGNGYFNNSTVEPLAQDTFLADGIQITFSASTVLDSTRKTEISLSTPQEIYSLEPSDVISINLSSGTEFFTISDVVKNISEEVTKVIVFGSIKESSTASSAASFYKRSKRGTAEWGLSPTILEYPGLLSAGIVQIANPNSPAVISNRIIPNSIVSSDNFTLEIDSKVYTVNCYNSLYSFQTLEIIISTINESLLEQGAGALAYKVFSNKTGQYELAIVSNFYGTDKYIKISSGSNSLILLGLADYSDKNIYGTSGNFYSINGKVYSSLKELMNLTALTLVSGSNSITGATFSSYQIKKGDVINISGSNQDNGSYLITNVTSNTIYVDSAQLPGGSWISNSSPTTSFVISRNTVSFDSYNFIESSGSPEGSLFELLIDDNSNFVYRTKLEYQMAFYSGKSLYSFVDCSQISRRVDEVITFEYDGTDVFCYLDPLYKNKITNFKNTYLNLFSKQSNISYRIMIYNAVDISAYITLLGAGTTFTSNIYIYSKPEYSNVLLIGNVSYSSANGRVEGGNFRLPFFFDIKDSGTLKYKDLGEDSKKALQIIPTSETRTSGVVKGLEILSASLSGSSRYLITVAPGVAYISGKRFEFDLVSSFDTGILATSFDKIIIFINNEGLLFADSADSATCNFFLNNNDNIVIGTVEYNSSILQNIDQRLIISDIDLKILNSITVSPVPGMGHFTSVNNAVKYAKRFSQLYPDAGVPEIILKAGTHKINVDIPLAFSAKTNADLIKYYDKYGIYLDFPVKIFGEGDSTVLDIITGYNDYPISGDDRATNARNRGYIVVNGAGSTSYSDFSNDVFNDGNIILSNFKLKNSTVLYIDPKVLNTSTYSIQFHKIKIKDVYFDWSNSLFDTATFTNTNYFKNSYAIKLILNSGTTNDYIGNIDVESCTFDTSYIDLSESASFLNISIKNNYFFSQDKKTNSTANSFLIKVPAIFNLFLFLTKNASILGNFAAGSTTSNGLNSYLFSNPSGIFYFDPSESFFQGINTNSINADGNLSVDGNTTLGSSSGDIITIEGSSTFESNAEFNDQVIFNQNVTFNNPITTENIIPALSATYDLGSVSSIWNNLYSKNITTDVSGTSSLLGNATLGSSSSNTLSVNSTTTFNSNASFNEINSDLIPASDSTYDVGSSSNKWSSGYINTFYATTIDNLGVLGFTGVTKVGYGIMIGANSSPSARIHIKQLTDSAPYVLGPGIRFESSLSTNYWEAYYATGDKLQFAWNGTALGYLNDTGSDSQLNFTGQHKCCVITNDDVATYKDMIGLIVVASGTYSNTSDEKNKPTINESLPNVTLSSKSRQKNVFGIISDAEDLNETKREYAIGNFVSIFNKEPSKDDTRVVINSLGEGAVWIINQNGNLENGDYITTSDAPGYGMKQDDDILRNYTVAKITQDCNFDNLDGKITKEISYNGKKYIAMFVGCTYHCG